MIIDCEAALVSPGGDRVRFSRARVGLANDTSGAAVVVVVTAQWKEKLKIRDNCVVRKTTISFVTPKRDLYLRNYDPLLFKAFVTMMSRIRANQLTTKLANASTLEKMRPKPTSLTITSQSFNINDLSNKCLQKLSVENLRTIPRLIWKLNNLVELKISECELTDIAIKMHDLGPTLRILDLSRNHIRAIDGSFMVAMRQLKTLDVSRNKLAYIPLEIKAMRSLERLNVSHNELTSLANTLGTISSLKHLDISHNNVNVLSVSLIKQLYLNTHLDHLDTSGNPLRERTHKTSILKDKPFPSLQRLCLAKMVSTDRLLFCCHKFMPQTIYKDMQLNAEKCCLCGDYVVDKNMLFSVIHQSLDQIAVSLTSTRFPTYPMYPSTRYLCHSCLYNQRLI